MNPPIPPLDETPMYVKLLSWGVLAGTGGAVKFISASLKATTAMSSRRFLFLLAANVFISGFTGLIGALLFSSISPDHTWQLVSAGVFGYGGPQLLDIMVLTMTKRVTNEAPPVSSVIAVPASVDPAASSPKP